MRPMKLTLVCLTALLPLSTLAASTDPVVGERALREECSAFSQGNAGPPQVSLTPAGGGLGAARPWGRSQAGMRDCLVKTAETSQKALRQAEEMVAGTLSKWDEDSKYISLAKARLAASSKEFARYRDAHCAFSLSLGGGAAGNALDMRRLACVSELNNRRAQQLRDAVSGLPLK